MEYISQAITIICLIVINGFFVASETALLQVRRTKIASLTHKENRLARLMAIALANMDIYISATQIGNTITSIALGWLGHPILEKILFVFAPAKNSPLYFLWNATLVAVGAFIILTLFNLIFGELIPKLIILYNPLTYGMILITPLSIFVMIFLPIINFFNRMAKKILALIGLSTSLFDKQGYSVKEIKIILNESHKDRVISKAEKIITFNVFRLRTIKIKNVMINIKSLVGFNADDTLAYIKKSVLSSHFIYNRYHIFRDPSKRIIGFIQATDILTIKTSVDYDKKIKKYGLIRKILTIKDSERADNIIIKMHQTKIHAAGVVDKSGKTIGLLVLSDLIHALITSSDKYGR